MTTSPKPAVPQKLQAAFLEQSDACDRLGSPFTAELCRTFAAHLDCETAVGKFACDWPGNPSSRADAIPLRLCGALHALALTKQDDDLLASYPATTDAPVPGPPTWTTLEQVLRRHETFILDWMQSPPQTNEVARSAALWPGLMLLSNATGLPIRLREVGSSAGLNLSCDQFRFTLGGGSDDAEFGDSESPLHLHPKWHGPTPTRGSIEIYDRLGCDIRPLDPADQNTSLRLRSFVWADQNERLQRLDAALSIAQRLSATEGSAHRKAGDPFVEHCDAVVWLERVLGELQPGTCTVVFSTIAWQYLPDDSKQAGEKLIRSAGAEATAEAPLAWLRFEGDGESPGGRISFEAWPKSLLPQATTDVFGRADFHGRWVHWEPPI